MEGSGVIGRAATAARGLRRGGRLALTALCGGVALVCAATVGLVWFLPAAADKSTEGAPVEAATAQIIMVGALSCPELTGARLAGTMMAASGMDPAAAGGIAGMSPDAFARWAPWPQAK